MTKTITITVTPSKAERVIAALKTAGIAKSQISVKRSDVWTDEQKLAQSVRMRELWKRRRMTAKQLRDYMQQTNPCYIF